VENLSRLCVEHATVVTAAQDYISERIEARLHLLCRAVPILLSFLAGSSPKMALQFSFDPLMTLLPHYYGCDTYAFPERIFEPRGENTARFHISQGSAMTTLMAHDWGES
jgi:hypothetical protein